MPNSAQLRSSVSTCVRLSSSRIRAATGVPSVGTLWSAVASVRSGRRTGRPASRSPSKACGLVTSWTRCRSMYRRLGATSWASQILSNRVLGHRGWGSSAPAQAGADHGQQHGLVGAGVLEAVGKVGVERGGVAGLEGVLGAVDLEDHAPALDQRDLAAARLVDRRVALAAGRGARRQHVAAELGALARQRRREDLERVAGARAAAAAAVGGADDADDALLVQAQELAEPELEAGGDATGDGEGRAGLAALDLGEHGRADAAALGEVAQRQVHGLAQGPDARSDVDLRLELVDERHGGAYVITYKRSRIGRRPRRRAAPGGRRRAATRRAAT